MKHEIADSIGNDGQSAGCLKSIPYEFDVIFELYNKNNIDNMLKSILYLRID